MKKISVIIPCYNVEDYLNKCFNSIKNQTIGLENLEIILVNDASTDHTLDLMLSIEEKYSDHVLVINCEKNHRQGGARNIGLSYATCEYISFIDSDDWIDEELYEKTYGIAKEYDCDIVQFRYKKIINEESVLRKDKDKDKLENEFIMTYNNDDEMKRFLFEERVDCSCTTKLYKKELLDRAGVSFPEGVVYEEPLFTYPLKFYGKRFYILEEELYYYRQNETGTIMNTMRNPKTIMQHLDVQMQLWEFMKKTEFFTKFYNEIELYFIKSYFIEPIYFCELRNFDISNSFKINLLKIVKKECPNFMNNPYIESYKLKQ